ncbi:MAG TPA: hypothetical protein VMZ33_06750 [Candidatus Limnocylindrales bacterium]|nr:hypothetical protein [Candidatus Limnocylindrales bacterium]
MTDDDQSAASSATFDDTERAIGQEEGGGGRGRSGCGVIGCVLIIVVLVALVAGTYVLGQRLEPLADRFLWAPHDVVREYLTAYEEGDLDRARGFLCAARQNAGVPDPSEAVGSPRSWTAGVEDQFPYPRPDGQVGIYYRVTSGLGDQRAQALLVREEDGWRICEFSG